MANRSARPLKIGINLPEGEGDMGGETARWNDLVALARRCEEVGFDSVWIADHLIYRFPDTHGSWECWSVIAALAAVTERVEIGTLVLGSGFRNPALVAKMAETVDEICGGRLILGIGAGYHEPEYRAFGYPYDYRFSRFEEALKIIHGLLHEGQVDFEGRFWQTRECELRPRGPRSGGKNGTIPLMLGTTGEKMLRLTARYADIWNTWSVFDDSRPSAISRDRAKVDTACADVGRDPATLARSVTVLVDVLNRRDNPAGLAGFLFGSILSQTRSYGRTLADLHPVGGSPEEMATTFRGFAEEGITHLQVYLTPNTLEGVEAFAPVLELLDGK